MIRQAVLVLATYSALKILITMRNIYKSDCRYFLGDRPCAFHKISGVKCVDCRHYDSPAMRLLIIKLGAMGDVLRTTSLLPTIQNRYDRPHITWVTLAESVPLFGHHPLVDAVMACGSETLARLQVERFDLLINPEASKESAALATVARAVEKRGFGLSDRGAVFAFNQGAADMFPLGLFDDLKKDNRRSYEQLVCRLAEIPYRRVRPQLQLSAQEIAAAKDSLLKAGIVEKRPVVMLNTGGGGRWRYKRWTADGFIGLAKALEQRCDAQVLVAGGPGETDFNLTLMDAIGDVAVDLGCNNPVRRFASLIACCDLLVTGDSLALHMGLALGRRVIALFGPTSAAEVDLYDQGEKILSDLDCLCCYLQTCDKTPNCMQAIDVETVFKAVRRQLALIGPESENSRFP
jgi:heptosyltransferase-2